MVWIGFWEESRLQRGMREKIPKLWNNDSMQNWTLGPLAFLPSLPSPGVPASSWSPLLPPWSSPWDWPGGAWVKLQRCCVEVWWPCWTKPGPRGRSGSGNTEKTQGTRSKQWKPRVQVAMQIQHITGGWRGTCVGPSTCAFFSFSLLFFWSKHSWFTILC